MHSIRPYLQGGVVQFDKLLSLSMSARIPSLTHDYGFEKIHQLLIVMLKAFNDSLNLIRPMTDEQVVEIGYELVMTTEEDQLSIEDYVLFFKGAKEGKYGKILDRLDQQTVFQMLEEYRQARHIAFVKIKEEEHLQYKALGPADRTVEKNELAESMANIVGRLGEMKEKLKEQREINRANRL